jgi:hypothetical protein
MRCLAGAGGLEPTTLGFGGVGYRAYSKPLGRKPLANHHLRINGLAWVLANLRWPFHAASVASVLELRMAETPSETHNRLAREFVMMAGTQTHSREELLVVVESTMLAAMQLMVKLHGAKAAHASILMEGALQNATERFGEGAQ